MGQKFNFCPICYKIDESIRAQSEIFDIRHQFFNSKTVKQRVNKSKPKR
jgi:hypothetical protein